MRIWIDGFEANVPQRLGSSQVAFELLRNLEKIDRKNEYTVLLASDPLGDLPKERSGWKYQILKINFFKTYIAIPFALFSAKKKPDIFFSPTHYGPFISPVKRIITIFDLSFLHFPQFFKPRDFWQLRLWTKISVLGARHIITISEFSKNDIVKNYNLRADAITVAHPGYKDDIYRPLKDQNKIKEVLKKYKIDSPYAIYIGTIQPRKNIARLIEAFKDIEGLKLVVVGKTTGEGRQGWMFDEILNKPRQLGIEDKVIFTGFVSDEDLTFLLNGAEVFVLPSLWEGFGIPVVDAMACGVPVIVSNVSSLPEVAGDAGILVDPFDIDSIAQAIRKVVTDRKFKEQKSKEGLTQAKRFSWQKMAEIVLQTFKEVAK